MDTDCERVGVKEIDIREVRDREVVFEAFAVSVAEEVSVFESSVLFEVWLREEFEVGSAKVKDDDVEGRMRMKRSTSKKQDTRMVHFEKNNVVELFFRQPVPRKWEQRRFM